MEMHTFPSGNTVIQVGGMGMGEGGVWGVSLKSLLNQPQFLYFQKLPNTHFAYSPLGCHISDVNRHSGGD